MKSQTIAALIPCALFMIGCVNPPYKFAPNEPTAKLKVLHTSSISICRDSKWYSLQKAPKQEYFQIPAGQRLLLSTFGYFSDYNVSYSCYPHVGFKPEPGIVYFTDMNIVENICMLEVARENPAAKTGLERETSIGPTYCGGTTN